MNIQGKLFVPTPQKILTARVSDLATGMMRVFLELLKEASKYHCPPEELIGAIYKANDRLEFQLDSEASQLMCAEWN